MSERWTPVDGPGGRYCSPACGRSCTKAEYLVAQRMAAELCADLGDGWEPVVHENLGWHYGARKGKMTVNPPYGRAFLGDRNGTTHTCFFNIHPQIVTQDPDPRQAVASALTQARLKMRENEEELARHD